MGGTVAVWEDLRAGNADLYAQRVDGTGYVGVLSNIDAAQVYTPYWDAPVVPRNALAGGVQNVHVTATLDGDAPTTRVNALLWQEGPNAMPPWDWVIALDGVTLTQFTLPDGNAPGMYSHLDLGPYTVRGGRHTLSQTADPPNAVPETSESDNIAYAQWVWSPVAVVHGVPWLRSAPPDPGLGVHPNGDGFTFSRDPSFAWVVGSAPLSPADDVDLWVYDNYAGSTSGFSNVLKRSQLGGNAVDFVVGHFTNTPTTVYPEIVRGLNASGSVVFDPMDAVDRNALDAGAFADQVLAVHRVADVYEAGLTAGTEYTFWLERNAGASDLRVEIFPATTGRTWRRGEGLRTGVAVSADLDTLHLEPSVSGWHPLVVCRSVGTEATQSVTYTLHWTSDVVGVEPLPDTPRPSFAGALPNPARAGTGFAFVLTREGPAGIDLFDVSGRRVWSWDDDAVAAGSHRVVWDARGTDGSRLPAGIYLARLRAEGRTFVRKVGVIP
jgi:hypothetical protein